MNKNLKIFIGGAPTTGKSTVAAMLSKHLDLPWLSTDQIRKIQKSVANKKEYPEIFNSVGYSADEFLEKFSAEEIVAAEINEAKTVWKAIVEMMKEAQPWGGFIVEGVHVLPHFIDEHKENENVKGLFLMDEDSDRLRKTVFERGVFSEPETYSDESKEKEIEWVSLFGKKLKEDVEKSDHPLIEVNKNETDLKLVLEALELN